ncbi:hypothetical protein [Spirilliplanes yamanashiensis]|uniref:Uncharacterized protein n=1 Tax=Spirilliplanes yamanashiensis TaxID=42233 RepID=A0A8J4DK45_9ACTN|nr:hypothetical protein [Spirilliplanes yamanashiensis]MDP9815659.1 hypothetical protein [Spirilliplanes yamanashiensis]GIJ03913.1 hypothetical protein Sya03_32650 [Spirilliplanes yamanashiensis]
MAAYEAWLAQARSALWFVRVRAGQELSFHAGRREVDAVLRQLLADPADATVVARTADALLRSRDCAALRVFAAAWPEAQPAHAGQLGAALAEACRAPEDARRLAAGVRQLMTDGDERVRRGAALLADRVAADSPR